MRTVLPVLILYQCARALAQISLFEEDFTLQGASSACNVALNAIVSSCPEQLADEPDGRRYPSATLTALCAPACSTSVSNFIANVKSACGTWQYVDGWDNVAYPADSLPRYYQHAQILSCLKDSKNNWCSREVNNVTGDPVVDGICSECMLKYQQTFLNSPFGYSDSQVPSFNELKANCSVTGYPVTKPTALAINATTTRPDVTPTCAGTVIPVPANYNGDCGTITTANRICTFNLLNSNVWSNCSDIPKGGSICLPDKARCNLYRVKTGDTLIGLAVALNSSTTSVMLQAWNPFIDVWYRNFDSGQFIGQDICISNPLGVFTIPVISATSTYQITSASTTVPAPTDVAPSVNPNCGRYLKVKTGDNCNILVQQNSIPLSDFLFLNPQINTNCTNLWANYSYCILPVGSITTYSGHPLSFPGATGTPTSYNWNSLPSASEVVVPTETPIPYATGTRTDCAYYFSFRNSTYIYRCADVAQSYGHTEEELLQWNPSLTAGTNCRLGTNRLYCASIGEIPVPDTSVGEQQPIPAPGDTQPGVVTPCYVWATAEANGTCTQFLNRFSLKLAQFAEWNPGVGSNCQNLWLQTYYCVRGPGFNDTEPVFSGIPPTTTLTGTSRTTTTTSKTSSAAIPGPTREGTISTCNKWALADVSCADFLTREKVTLAQLYAWNPTVESDCRGMWGSYAYCVGVAGGATTTTTKPPTTTATTTKPPTTTTKPPTTTTKATTTTGVPIPSPTRDGTVANCKKWRYADVSCATILSSEGITMAQFYQWNPTVLDNCSGMWAQYYYCVKV